MKILIADVWSTHNTGDRAILEVLLSELERRFPGADLSVAAHFPAACQELGRQVTLIQDVLAFDGHALDAQLAHLAQTHPRLDPLRAAYETADLVVSTGGYFLNAWPDNPFTHVLLSRLLHMDWALNAGVPVAALGQSVGPFTTAELRAAARSVLGRLPLFTVRDAQSLSYLRATGVAPQAVLTADLATLLRPASDADVTACMARLCLPTGALGISVRLYPGTPGNAFADVARIADHVVRSAGIDVLLIGTTVPPSNLPDVAERERALGNDDLVALDQVHALMTEKARAVVCREALPPRLLKGVLGRCRAFLGTRMHATILAATAGVPTAGIAYEFKCSGWFDQLGLPDLVLPLAELSHEALGRLVSRLLGDADQLRAQLAAVVPEICQRATQNFALLEELLPGARREATSSRPWELEAHHYDVLHSRLRRIRDLVECCPGSRILDVGCGAGTLAAALTTRWAYHGCDISESACSTAKLGWVTLANLEAELPAFDGQPYDVIVASGILEYIEDVPALLRRIGSRLRAGGVLVASYFNMTHVARRAGAAFRHPLWRNDWSPADFRRLLAESGFAVKEVAWSTQGRELAPDVRDERAHVWREASQARTPGDLDDLAHTLIYVCEEARVAAPAPVRRPRASVVIPVFNRLELLAPVLDGFATQEDAEFDVTVVDDGSEPPVRSIWRDSRRPGSFSLVRHDQNRGRGNALNTAFAASRGAVVIVCDADIVPEHHFVRDHLQFHERFAERGATHLGALDWGIEPGLYGVLAGARANPRMRELRGPVDWMRWYTDNWSFKRELIEASGLRFDPFFKRWGFEELELAWRLQHHGATNTWLDQARGRHLKPCLLDGLLASCRRSVPNLLYFARIHPEAPLRAWLQNRFSSTTALDVCEALTRTLWKRCQELDARFAGALRDTADPIVHRLAVSLSDAVFRLGIARGFFQECQAGDLARVDLPPTNDLERALEFASLSAALYFAQAALGEQASAHRLLAESARFVADAGAIDAAIERLYLERAMHEVEQMALSSKAQLDLGATA